MGASVFSQGFAAELERLLAEIVTLYLADSIPWIVGVSGGKDSTATLQLVWLALRQIPAEKRHKTVHVISTDTLVENPVIARWAEGSLGAMREAAAREGLPIEVHRLTPAVADSFWVLLIGKGYPAPRNLFRWCTDRLKLRPSNTFIRNVISERGEAILLLGTRKAESSTRAARMERLEAARVRDRLSPNASLPGSLVHSPIEDWSNDDVWLFLLQVPNPWGWSNKNLMNLYAGASADGECPVVVDTSTPSCGASRFGCWVCTLVEQDKSMQAMVQNDADKEWMLPLLDLRNDLDFRLHEDGDRPIRDFRRMNGRVQLMTVGGGGSRPIPGPYTQKARAGWLRKLLQAERAVRAMAPANVGDIRLISVPELEAIRRIWLDEKHEVEDLAPTIYTEVTGEPWPGVALEPHVLGMDAEMLALLREVASDEHDYAMMRDLLVVAAEYRTAGRRAGLYAAIERVLRRYQFRSEEEALAALGGTPAPQLDLFKPPPAVVTPRSEEEHKAEVVARLSGMASMSPLAGMVLSALDGAE